MTNNSELTAITRNKLSVPTKYLLQHDLLIGRILDYGCGKGFDVNYVKKLGYNIQGFDPYYFPEQPKGTYDTIICNYVLNVLEKENEEKILEDINNLLSAQGTAYLTVRRDIDKEGYRKKGRGTTYQRNVNLNEESIKEDTKLCIYKITKRK